MASSAKPTVKTINRVLPACQAEKSEFNGKDGILQSQEVKWTWARTTPTTILRENRTSKQKLLPSAPQFTTQQWQSWPQIIKFTEKVLEFGVIIFQSWIITETDKFSSRYKIIVFFITTVCQQYRSQLNHTPNTLLIELIMCLFWAMWWILLNLPNSGIQCCY